MDETFEVCGNIGVTPYPLLSIREYEVHRKLNEHDRAIIKGIADAQTFNKYLFMQGGDTCITLYCQKENKRQLLFSGFLDSMDMCEVGGHREVILRLSGLTGALERKEKLLDYQAENKSLHGLIEKKMAGYEKLGYEVFCEDKKVPDFWLQYEETDYAFLKRLLSKEQAPVYTRLEGKWGKICFGRKRDKEEAVRNTADYQIGYDGWLYYRFTDTKLWDLGTKLVLNGKRAVVRAAVYSLKEGAFENEYLLCEEKDFRVEEIKNSKATGISLDGTIVERLRDKVKIRLNGTPQAGEDELRWFGYSSVAASSSGSGWYCMPEIGEEIRLYCPTEEEKEAYVISAIRSPGEEQAEGGQDAKKPSNKSLSNVQGQTVEFTPEGVSLSCAGGTANMVLSNTGEIVIVARDTIELLSEQNIDIRAEEGVIISAANTISLVNDTGGSMQFSDTITLDANRIKNNC